MGGFRTFAATSISYRKMPKADICDDLKATNLLGRLVHRRKARNDATVLGFAKIDKTRREEVSKCWRNRATKPVIFIAVDKGVGGLLRAQNSGVLFPTCFLFMRSWLSKDRLFEGN